LGRAWYPQFVKKETAIAGNGMTPAREALRPRSELARGVAAACPQNTVARKMSRLSKRSRRSDSAPGLVWGGVNQGTKLWNGRRIFRRPFSAKVKFSLPETSGSAIRQFV
jgi:hypothetical protein